MLEAAQNLEFEKAALLRDQIEALKNKDKVASKASKSGYKKKSKGIYNKDGIPKRRKKS
jgi:excinuclease UvrABC nuclease subunit